MIGTGHILKGLLSNLAVKKREAERPRTPTEIEETFNRLMVCNSISVHARLKSAIRSRAYLLVEVKRSPRQKGLIRRLLFDACRRLDIALAPRKPNHNEWRPMDDGEFGLFAVLDDGSDSMKITQLCSSRSQIGLAIKVINRRNRA